MNYSPEIIERLSKLEIFSDFDTGNEDHVRLLKSVCEILEPIQFESGDLIIKEGDVGDSLYILYEGSVQVRRKTPNNEDFAVANLTKEQNIFFGEVALVDEDTRSASVYALTDCNTLKLSGKRFKALCDREPLLGYHVLYKIARRIAGALRNSSRDILLLYEALLDEVHGE